MQDDMYMWETFESHKGKGQNIVHCISLDCENKVDKNVSKNPQLLNHFF